MFGGSLRTTSFYLFTALLLLLSLTACKKDERILFTEFNNETGMRLLISDEKGSGGTDITPQLTAPYVFNGQAKFSRRTKNLILLVGEYDIEGTSAMGTTIVAQREFALFSCDLEGKNVKLMHKIENGFSLADFQ